MAVEGDPGIAGVPLDAVEDLARELLALATVAELGTLGVVKLVQLGEKVGGFVCKINALSP